MNRKYILLFVLLFVCATPETTIFAQVKFVPSPRLSNLRIRDIRQDSSGYLWIATAQGLNRYNGYEYALLLKDENAPQATLPSNNILRILPDRSGDLWIATSRGLCRYDPRADRIIPYPLDEKNEYHITDLASTPKGTIWMSTFRYGVYRIDAREGKPVRLDVPDDEAPQTAQAILPEGEETLWIGYSNPSALCRYATTKNQSDFFPLPNYIEINCLARFGDTQVWIGTDQGIIAYDTRTRKQTALPASLRNRPKLSGAKIYGIALNDKKEYTITSSCGAYKYTPKTDRLIRLSSEFAENSESNDITCTLEDRQGNLWFGSYAQGIHKTKKTDGTFLHRKDFLAPLDGKSITACCEDRKFGRLWFGSQYNGLYSIKKDGTVRHFDVSHHADFGTTDGNFIRTLFCDEAGQIWIGAGRHLIIGRLDAEGFREIATFRNFGRILTVAPDGEGNIWIGGSSGLYCFPEGATFPTQAAGNTSVTAIAAYGKNRIAYSAYEQDILIMDNRNFEPERLFAGGKPDSPAMNACSDIYRARNGELWAGSHSQGLLRYDPPTGKTVRYTRQNGLPSNDVLAVSESADGQLWITTSAGLSKLDTRSGRISNFNESDGLRNTQFYDRTLLYASDGYMYIGGNSGVDCIRPDSVKPDSYCPPVILEDLKVQNRSVVPGAKGSPVSESIAFTDEMILSHRQNSFSIDYAGIDYNHSGKLRYAYRLEGFDKDWIEAGSHRRASYSNLSPGRYRFRLKVQNGDGIWSPETSIDIRIKASPWLTGWAYVLYILTALSLTVLITKLYFSTKFNKKSLELSETQRLHEQRIARQKIDFYDNISHELRTPLTLINGNIDLLLQQHKAENGEKKLLSAIAYNTNRLLKLIDQLLDFSKMENDALALRVAPTEIVPLVRNIGDSFRFNTKNKRIFYKLHTEHEHLRMYADEDMLEKIVTNLISNAVKYTPDHGSIRVEIRTATAGEVQRKYDAPVAPEMRYMEFEITNTSEPIAPEQLTRIFERFARLDASDKTGRKNGTGIGLHYTKSLIQKHRGYIRAVWDEASGLTMSFVVPVGAEAYRTEEICDPSPVRAAEGIVPPPDDELPVMREPGGKKAHTLLIVEDDAQIHSLLHDILHKDYDLLHAYDGEEGLKICREQMPDLIISDIRMPGTDGYELCSTVKNTPRLSHIPVILLTAKTRIEEQIEGYDCGADAYINKPFRIKHLQSVIRSQIGNLDRRKTRLAPGETAAETAAPEIPGGKPMPASLSDIDLRFLEKLHSFIDKSIENPDININVIAVELGFSRTSFYRKMKSLTGMAPNDYVRNFKMKKAAKLILEGNLSIAEISDQTGFGTQSHFSTAFKKYFGVSPKDYKDKHRKGPARPTAESDAKTR